MGRKCSSAVMRGDVLAQPAIALGIAFDVPLITLIPGDLGKGIAEDLVN
jgi:hypothetical protein